MSSNGRCAFTLESDVSGERYTDWECPHTRYADENRCIFHLPPEERERLDITDGEVSQAFEERVQESGRERKQFVGARFGDLELDHRVLEATDRFPIDLSHAEVAGTLDLRETTINQPLYVEGCEIGHLALFKTQFTSLVDLTNAEVGDATVIRSQFQDEVSFKDAKLQDGFDLSESVFNYRCEFDEASVGCDFIARETRFNHDVSFQHCELEGDLVCEGAEFNGGANVQKDDADFSNIIVHGVADFSQTEFRYGCFDGADFESDASFTMSLFREGASFEDMEIVGKANFEDAAFEWELDVTGADFRDETDFHFARFQKQAAFDETTFRGAATFQEADFEGDASFEDVVFDANAVFAGSSFEGGAEIERDDANFASAEFRGQAEFRQARFRYANFRGTEFSGPVTFREAHVKNDLVLQNASIGGDLNLEHATLDGRVDLTELAIGGRLGFEEVDIDGDFSLRGSTVEGQADFTGAEFNGGAKVQHRDADFEDVRFEGEVTFDHAEFRKAHFGEAKIIGTASFENTVVNHDCSFRGLTVSDSFNVEHTRFGQRCDWSDATFDGEVRFDEVIFDGRTDLTDARFAADLEVVECVFDDDLLFTEAAIQGETTFRGVEFHGGANVKVEDANFNEARFHGPTRFDSVEFRSASFDHAIFGDTLRFTDSEFELDASFEDTHLPTYTDLESVELRGSIEIVPNVNNDVLIDLEHSYLQRGRLSQPDEASAYYDCTRATIGDVNLITRSPRQDGHLMEKFLFKNTDFERFDFSGHRDYLTKNHWVLHSLDLDDDHELRQHLAPSFEDDELETTYLKAKNSASAVGDNKAASEFYIKETIYRRNQYKQLLLPSEDSLFSWLRPLTLPFLWPCWKLQGGARWIESRAGRFAPVPVKSGGKYGANLFFYYTCGYGERPSRVVVSSIAITTLFFGFYAALDVNLENEGYLGHFVYSAQAFVSLIVGTPEGSTTLINLVTAVEAFTGAFFIALFVFTLTRSMHR